MSAEFIVGIDSSTQSTKAIAWSRDGIAIAEGRSTLPMSQPEEGRFEQEPEHWWEASVDALRKLGRNVDMSDAKAVAVSNQRETIGFLDRDGGSIRPAMVWLDERARTTAAQYSQSFGANDLHRISGKPVDLTPAVYRLHWLSLHEPDTLKAVAQFVDVHGYLAGWLTGRNTASWTSADPMGTFDISAFEWSTEILGSLGLTPSQFAPAVAPGTKIGHVTEKAAVETGLPAGLPVIAAGGDGQCAGLGVDAMQSGRAYLNLGTALVIGAWGQLPTPSHEWRTMCSPTGEGYFYEGVLRAGTFLVDWFVKNFVDPEPDASTFEILERQATAIPVGSSGVLVSPYLSGSMNPHWSMDASASIFGLRPSHGQGHIYRAILESLTGEVARTVLAMQKLGVKIEQIVAVGGGTNSALWRSMIADATGLPLRVSESPEASSLGAAITAAKGIGWYPDFASAAEAMSTMGDSFEPVQQDCAAWRALLEQQDALNRILVAESARIA